MMVIFAKIEWCAYTYYYSIVFFIIRSLFLHTYGNQDKDAWQGHTLYVSHAIRQIFRDTRRLFHPWYHRRPHAIFEPFGRLHHHAHHHPPTRRHHGIRLLRHAEFHEKNSGDAELK